MERTFRQQLWMLYKKDVMNLRTESLLLLAFAAGLNIYAYIQILRADNTLNAAGYGVLSSMIVFGALFWVFIRSFSLVSSEWKDNTLHMIMPLPIGGKSIFFSKLMALFTQILVVGTITVIFALGSATLILGLDEVTSFFRIFNIASEELILGNISEIIKMIIFAFVNFGQLLVIVFFSSVVGRMFKKLSGPITFVVFILSSFIISRITFLIDRMVTFDSQAGFSISGDNVTGMETTINFMSTPEYLFGVFYALAFGALFFFATTYLYDRKVEL